MTLLDLIEKIKTFEGFSAYPYRDSGGTMTIGYGFTDSKSLKYDYMPKETASKILTEKVINTYESVCIYMDKMGYHNIPCEQLYALTDFTYNLGMGNLKKLIKPNPLKPKRTMDEIKKAIPLYCKCKGKTLRGLQNRREWEVYIWN